MSTAVSMQKVQGGVTAARGFRAGALLCGIKAGSDKPDLGIVLSDRAASAAGVFTQNRAAAAPVALCRAHLSHGRASAVVANSGNANACTGAQGTQDAQEMARSAAARFGLASGDVLVLSTGVIGVPLPIERIRDGIARLQVDDQGGAAFAHAIMTTDTRVKMAAMECTVGDVPVRVGGCAKGSGMIHPNMATMLSVITTDAMAEPAYLRAALGRAVDQSFNLISVDGDTSTNDSVILLANGAAGNVPLTEGHAGVAAFEQALRAVCIDLAKEIVRDGEGARTLIEVQVTGARSDDDARLVARAVTSSSLVKTAVFGGDPNWGRVLCAAGYAGADLDVERATLRLGDLCLLAEGAPQPFDRSRASTLLRAPDVEMHLDLGLGHGSATAWGCDMSYEYVRINAEYTT